MEINSSRMDITKAEFVGILQENKQNMTVKPEGKKFQQYLCAVIASIGSFVIGTVLAWTSPSLEFLEYTNYSAPFQTHSSEEGDWIAAWTPFGAIVGAIPAGMLADAFGRKSLLMIFTVPWIGTWILTIFASHVYYLYAARFVSGIIVGLFCAVLPLYVNEIAEDSIRGTLGTLFQLFLTGGILFDYTLAVLQSYTIVCYSALSITVAFFIFVMFIPETPIYCMKKHRRDEAERSLRRLRGPYYDVQSELNEIRKNLEAGSEERFSFRTLFKRANAKALIISVGLMLCQQFSGINAVIFFAGTIFEEAGAKSPEMCTIIVGIMQTLATGLSSVLVDRAGRKILLLISSTGTAVCLAFLGYYFSVEENDPTAAKGISWLPLVSVVMLIIVFSLGLGPLPWMMSGEVLAPEIKSFGTAVSVAINWICVSIVTFFFQPLMKLISNAYTFWLFSVWCVFATVFVFIFIPETKGKSIEEVQNILAGRKPSQAMNGKV